MLFVSDLRVKNELTLSFYESTPVLWFVHLKRHRGSTAQCIAVQSSYNQMHFTQF